MFVAWENKLYFVVCGTRGSTAGGLTIRTLPVIMLAIRVNEEVGVDEFFDPNTLVRNIVALFGIPPNRVRIASVVPDSGRRRRLAGRGLGGRGLEESFLGSEVKLQIEQADPCDELTCGHGDCAHPTAAPPARATTGGRPPPAVAAAIARAPPRLATRIASSATARWRPTALRARPTSPSARRGGASTAAASAGSQWRRLPILPMAPVSAAHRRACHVT